MLNMGNQDYLDQDLSQHLFDITRIHVEEVIYIQNQHQYMYQFINQFSIFLTQEVTSVDYHKEFLEDSLIFFIRKLVMLL